MNLNNKPKNSLFLNFCKIFLEILFFLMKNRMKCNKIKINKIPVKLV